MAEEGGVVASWQLDARGMCMAYQAEQARWKSFSDHSSPRSALAMW